MSVSRFLSETTAHIPQAKEHQDLAVGSGESYSINGDSAPKGDHTHHVNGSRHTGASNVINGVHNGTNGIHEGTNGVHEDGNVDRLPTFLTLELPALSPSLGIQVVLSPAEYISSLPSKNVRDLAADDLNVWLDVPAEDLAQIKQVVNTLHNASLMLDDVEDGSSLRRGQPAAHMVFGTAQTINSAGYQVITAISQATKLNDQLCVSIVVAHDIYWSSGISQPSTEEFLKMVDYKTGGFFRILAGLIYVKSSDSSIPASGLIMNLSMLLGRYFQIRDDYMNLSSTDYTKQKGFCEDLDEGKFSLMMIHAMENAQRTDKMVLQGVLDQRHLSGSMSAPAKGARPGIDAEARKPRARGPRVEGDVGAHQPGDRQD
ncbi:hypothetical protein PG994_003298 [Apiospora phragmitis]|uniref:Uncharacterized protein n=1 Tax=Apiospora phragmitis TaxID=2905665 RepID=A0ABR1W0E6_9PEZI